MSNQEDIGLSVTLLTRSLETAELGRPLETADLIFLKGIKAKDLRSDDRCAICHQRYETPNEDGTTPEDAVHFPCGHAVGNACFHIWIDGVPQPACIFCNKSLIPARYLQEQVEEISTILTKMSWKRLHDELSKKTTRGPLSRAVEPLWRYVDDAPSLEDFRHHNERLTPTFEWLIIATREFLAALNRFANISAKTNCHEIYVEALKRRQREVALCYESFQSVVKEMVVEKFNKR